MPRQRSRVITASPQVRVPPAGILAYPLAGVVATHPYGGADDLAGGADEELERGRCSPPLSLVWPVDEEHAKSLGHSIISR